MENNNSGGVGGMGGVLFIVFLVLKLTDTVDWGWGMVTAPLWIPILIWIVIVAIMFAVAVIIETFSK